MLGVVFDGVSNTVHYQLSNPLGDSYYRFQIPLDAKSDDRDNVTPDSIRRLMLNGRAILREQQTALEELCERLTQ